MRQAIYNSQGFEWDDGNSEKNWLLHEVTDGECEQEQLKEIPRFTNEDEEREFWASHDSTEYVDWDKADLAVFPQLKPTTKSISLRLPLPMLNEIRLLANKRDVPYQSLIKMFLHERIDQELRRDIPKGTA